MFDLLNDQPASVTNIILKEYGHINEQRKAQGDARQQEHEKAGEEAA